MTTTLNESNGTTPERLAEDIFSDELWVQSPGYSAMLAAEEEIEAHFNESVIDAAMYRVDNDPSARLMTPEMRARAVAQATLDIYFERNT